MIYPLQELPIVTELQKPIVDTTVREKLAEKIHSFANMSTQEIVDTIAQDLISFGWKVLTAFLIFLVGRWLIRRIVRFMDTIFERRNIEVSLRTFLKSLVRITLYILLVFTVVGVLGINITSFLAIFASAGLAVGMALSGTLQNFAGGVMILLLKPYRVGDWIEAQGQAGTVKDIYLFNTVLNTADNKSIIVPNSAISTSIINNYSREKTRRVEWTVSLSYGDDFDRVKAAILEILNADKRILQDPAPFVGLGNLGASSIDFTVRVWVLSGDYWSVFYDVYERIYKHLPEKGLSFPFPQLDVRVTKN